MSKKVIFCTPTVTKPYPAYLAALEASVAPIQAAGWDEGATNTIGNAYISYARSEMLRKAMDAKADVVVFIDHDLSWAPGDLLKLIETPGDVVAGTYRYKSEPEEYMSVLDTDENHLPQTRADGCIRARAVPAGFVKVTEEAVAKFMRAYPELVYGPPYSPSVDLFNHGAHKGIWWGEDYAFSRRWNDCGGEIWIVPDLNITHHLPDKAFPGNLHQFLMKQPGGALDPAQQIKLRYKNCGQDKPTPGTTLLGDWVCDGCYYGPPPGYGNRPIVPREAA